MTMDQPTSPPPSTAGIHHVTALCSDAQQNIDFFTGVLGLRLVKITVNFDDPFSYHLYYGDARGTPGTILTFFVWPGTSPAISPAAIAGVQFAIPPQAADYWLSRLAAMQTPGRPITSVDGRSGVQITGPDGIHLELLCEDPPESANPSGGPLPDHVAISRIAGVTLASRRMQESAFLFSSELGLRAQEMAATDLHPATIALSVPGAPVPCLIIQERSKLAAGNFAPGKIHHVAFRARDAVQQKLFQQNLAAAKYRPTEIAQRLYFQSIYFLEPGGAVCEIATDGPGFAVDEPSGELGSGLKLPPWLETRRTKIERALPPLKLHNMTTVLNHHR